MGLDKKLIAANVRLSYFGVKYIPLLFFVTPRIVSWDENSFTVLIPLTRRSRNHLRSMYFGALAIGADLAGGFVAMEEIRASKQKIALIFKDFKADFHKRAEGDVHFVCEQNQAIKELVSQAVATGERVELPVLVKALVPSKFGQEPVATFTLTLSLKKK
jgi:acyl-coenzyme A thioesterase PaaI-like protein